jgi:hypothetical protein
MGDALKRATFVRKTTSTSACSAAREGLAEGQARLPAAGRRADLRRKGYHLLTAAVREMTTCTTLQASDGPKEDPDVKDR